jgi:hypothetical protein
MLVLVKGRVMDLQPLPPEVDALLHAVYAPSQLIRHLAIVHDVALTIMDHLGVWPKLQYDREAVRLGAATHDTGKAVHPEELIGPGARHEQIGPVLLVTHGFPPHHARFARTHGQWAEDSSLQLEDLLVALADTIWKGKRDEQLELRIARHIAAVCGEESWQIYMQLDDMLSIIARDADARLAWASQ